MKKLLALFITLTFVLTLAACGEADVSSSDESSSVVSASQTASSVDETSSEQSTVTETAESKTQDTSSEATSDKKETSSVASSSQSTSSENKPSEPAKLNPKTDFKYGKFVSKYFSADKKEYTICTLIFNKEYESVEYQNGCYYTKEECERLYGDFGFDADEPSEDFPSISVNGVTYYTPSFSYVIIPESLEITDTYIKVTSDDAKHGTFSLMPDGALVLDSTDADGRYGSVGNVFAPVEE